jgi:Fe-S cluster biogenesis protein NfuA
MQQKVEKIIEKIRPYIQMHGGDVELLEVKDGTVKIKVSGACVGCAMAGQTYNGMLDGMIREEVPEVKEIIFEN